MLVEPEIAPLAKRLAEENNVNWRALTGSGANGRILERDVLEYLARVMAGEEDINPTAEPLPEGLDAWPEDDVKSYYGVDTSAEVSDFVADIDDASLFVDVAEPVAKQDDGLGEDIFLVDEGDVSVSPMTNHEPVQYDASLDSLEDDVVNVYGSLTLDDMGEEPEETLESEGVFDDAYDFKDSADAPMMFKEPFQEESSSEESSFENVSQGAIADTEALFLDEVEPITEAFAALATEPSQEFEAVPEIEEDVFVNIQEPELLAASYDPQDSSEDVTFDVVATQEDMFVPEAGSAEGFTSDLDALHEASQASGEAEEPLAQPVLTGQNWSESEAVPAVENFPVVDAVVSGTALGVQNTGVPLAQHLPLVTYGVLLRRHVDLSTLIQAQHAVSEEMGQQDPRIITCFLLRAAAKALHKVPILQGAVGLAAIHAEGVGLTAISEASSAPFRTIMTQTHQALGETLRHDTVGLAVADMSGFDIDEAVLNVGVPVLTLGRMMYDNSKGTHHSTLSISGNVTVESGTKFLSAVAELLDSPVRLVV